MKTDIDSKRQNFVKEEVCDALTQLNEKLSNLLESKLNGSKSEEQIEKLLNYRDELNEVFDNFIASKNDLLSPENSTVLKKILDDPDIQEGKLELEINQLTTEIWSEYRIQERAGDNETNDEELEAIWNEACHSGASNEQQDFVKKIDELVHFITQLLDEEPVLVTFYIPYTILLNTIRNNLPESHPDEHLNSLQKMQGDEALDEKVREKVQVIIDSYKKIKQGPLQGQEVNHSNTISTTTQRTFVSTPNGSKFFDEEPEIPIAKKHKSSNKGEVVDNIDENKSTELIETMSQLRRKLHNKISHLHENQPTPSTPLNPPANDKSDNTNDKPDNKQLNLSK